MSAVNCPMCELRFLSRSERDWHLRNEHEHLHVHKPSERRVVWSTHPSPDDEPREQPPPSN